MANTIGEKELKTKWPVEEGLTAGTQKQTGDRTLQPTETSTVLQDEEELLY